MAIAESHTSTHHDDHHHDHGEFIAHHFDNAEQQFDSGKLGIWVFLVTEILFFSGLFVAYTLYRNHHPEIFAQAHVYLDKVLGGINTVVLLFSSLTMALAVRAAQLGKNKQCGTYTLVTMFCAAIFLGVKAVEYSHKWTMGIFVRSSFELGQSSYQTQSPLALSLGISDYLLYLSVIPALLLVLFVVWSVIAGFVNQPNLSKLMMGLAITASGFFVGAVGGEVYERNLAGHHGGDHHDHDHDHAMSDVLQLQAAAPLVGGGGEVDPSKLHPNIGIFFSIYYCMTGLHAIHILAGIAALAWIYWRSIKNHWRSDYFGPVDYVGLYWHLVDLIWIFLFPLLYLID